MVFFANDDVHSTVRFRHLQSLWQFIFYNLDSLTEKLLKAICLEYWFEFHFQNNMQILSSTKILIFLIQNLYMTNVTYKFWIRNIKIFVEDNMFTVLYSLNPNEILYYCSIRLKFKMFRFPMNYIWLFSNVMIYHNVWWNGLCIHLTI